MLPRTTSTSGAWTEAGSLVLPSEYVRAQIASAEAANAATRQLEGTDEALFKALILGGTRPSVVPRQILPQMQALGLYAGVKDPGEGRDRTAQFLRRIAATPLMRTVISNLVNQVQSFGHKMRSKTSPGFEIVMADPDARPSPLDKKNMLEIERLFLQGGVEWRRSDGRFGPYSGDGQLRADPFPVMLEMLAYDSLILDFGVLLVEPGLNRKRAPIAWMKTTDAARIRYTQQKPLKPIVDPLGQPIDVSYTNELRARGVTVEYVELDEGRRVQNEYAWDEAIPFIRNHRSAVEVMGYGWPELASLVEIVAGMVTATRHNVEFFTHDRVPPGIMVGTGGFDQQWLSDFMRILQSPSTEGSQWHKVPMLFGEPDAKLTYTPFRQTEKQDMYWRQWMIYLLNVAYALFHVAAEEGNFQAFLTAGGQQSATGGEQRVSQMRWTGLRTTMQKLESCLNHNIVRHFWADGDGYGPYRLRFLNVITRDEERDRRLDIEDINAGLRTINEVRISRDERPYKDALDTAKMREIEAFIREKREGLEYSNPIRFQDLADRMYELMDGKWAMWPDAPVQGTLNMIWAQEHAPDLEPEVDEDDAWVQAQQQGPPQGFQEKMDVAQWKHAQNQQQQQPDEDDQDSNAEEQGPEDAQERNWLQEREAKPDQGGAKPVRKSTGVVVLEFLVEKKNSILRAVRNLVGLG